MPQAWRTIRVFVSYSHADERWVQEGPRGIVPWLADSLRRMGVVFWLDPELRKHPGVRYRTKIRQEIEKAQFALLLISQDFVNSEFIRTFELPLIRQRVESGQLAIIPLLVGPTIWEGEGELAWLAERQMLPGKPTPLIDYVDGGDAAWQRVRNEILTAIRHRVGNGPPAGDGWRLEATMANPHYQSDLEALERSGYQLASILGPETVVVVTGCSLQAELLDRPVAESLRDEIDRRGHSASLRRGVVIGDMWWRREGDLQRRPTISIGAPAVNSVSDEIASAGERWDVDGLCGAFLAEESPRVALWGASAPETAASVRRYCERSDGLQSFLSMIWR